jgi:Protein of unknown function (DUF3489)
MFALSIKHLTQYDLAKRCARPEGRSCGEPAARRHEARRVHQAVAPAKGVSIKEAAEALDWMEHSVRGAVAGALKKKYGLTIASEKIEGRGTVYRIED